MAENAETAVVCCSVLIGAVSGSVKVSWMAPVCGGAAAMLSLSAWVPSAFSGLVSRWLGVVAAATE